MRDAHFSAQGFEKLDKTQPKQQKITKKNQKPARVLLCGSPATGKTHTGQALESRFGWTHFDCEQFHKQVDAETFNAFLDNPAAFMPNTPQLVATWGFIPQFARSVKLLVANGFQPIWLFGDPARLDKELLNRSMSDPSAIKEMTDPLRALVAEAKQTFPLWQEVDVFAPSGERRDVAALLHEQFTTTSLG